MVKHFAILLYVRIAAGLLVAIAPAAVQADIYKHVDAEGNVSYSDVATVSDRETVNIDDTGANVYRSDEGEQDGGSDFLQQRLEKKKEQEARAKKLEAWRKELRAAQQELKVALAAQAKGVIAEEGDFIGSANGGARPSASYFQKLKNLDSQVEKARRKVADIKKTRPRL